MPHCCSAVIDDDVNMNAFQLTSENVVKVILLGDSAVGKSKLVERFLMNGYEPRQLSTYALTLFRHNFQHEESGDNIAAAVLLCGFEPPPGFQAAPPPMVPSPP